MDEALLLVVPHLAGAEHVPLGLGDTGVVGDQVDRFFPARPPPLQEVFDFGVKKRRPIPVGPRQENTLAGTVGMSRQRAGEQQLASRC